MVSISTSDLFECFRPLRGLLINIWNPVLGLTPQALCLRLLRRLQEIEKIQSAVDASLCRRTPNWRHHPPRVNDHFGFVSASANSERRMLLTNPGFRRLNRCDLNVWPECLLMTCACRRAILRPQADATRLTLSLHSSKAREMEKLYD